MKNIALIIILSLFVFGGCFASMPDPIKETYMQNKTPDEEKKLGTIEEDIIKLNKQREQMEKDYKITKQKSTISEKEITSLEEQKIVLIEKQKLYSQSNDNKKLEEVKKDIEKNENQTNYEQLNSKYLKALKEDQEALLEVKQGELGVKVAERMFERAKIARRYQDKTMGTTDTADNKDAKKENKDKIDVTEYENYLNKQADALLKSQQAQVKTAEALKQAEDRFKESGQQVEK